MQFKEVLTNFNNEYEKWALKWGLKEDEMTKTIVLNIINTTITKYRNFEINFYNEEEFLISLNNTIDEHSLTIINRARYLKNNFEFLKDFKNWSDAGGSTTTQKGKNTSNTGYQGYNAGDDEPFRKDWNDTTNTIENKTTNNPILLTGLIKNYFKDEIKAFEHDVEDLLQIIY